MWWVFDNRVLSRGVYLATLLNFNRSTRESIILMGNSSPITRSAVASSTRPSRVGFVIIGLSRPSRSGISFFPDGNVKLGKSFVLSIP